MVDLSPITMFFHDRDKADVDADVDTGVNNSVTCTQRFDRQMAELMEVKAASETRDIFVIRGVGNGTGLIEDYLKRFMTESTTAENDTNRHILKIYNQMDAILWPHVRLSARPHVRLSARPRVRLSARPRVRLCDDESHEGGHEGGHEGESVGRGPIFFSKNASIELNSRQLSNPSKCVVCFQTVQSFPTRCCGSGVCVQCALNCTKTYTEPLYESPLQKLSLDEPVEVRTSDRICEKMVCERVVRRQIGSEFDLSIMIFYKCPVCRDEILTSGDPTKKFEVCHQRACFSDGCDISDLLTFRVVDIDPYNIPFWKSAPPLVIGYGDTFESLGDMLTQTLNRMRPDLRIEKVGIKRLFKGIPGDTDELCGNIHEQTKDFEKLYISRIKIDGKWSDPNEKIID